MQWSGDPMDPYLNLTATERIRTNVTLSGQNPRMVNFDVGIAIFNQDTARSFRENILSKGGTEHPMTLYKRFRGQEPTIEALLKRNGIK